MEPSTTSINQTYRNFSPHWLYVTILIILSSLLLPQFSLAAEDDTEPPEFIAVNLAPTSIDVTSD